MNPLRIAEKSVASGFSTARGLGRGRLFVCPICAATYGSPAEQGECVARHEYYSGIVSSSAKGRKLRCNECGAWMGYGKIHEAPPGRGMGWRCRKCGNELPR